LKTDAVEYNVDGGQAVSALTMRTGEHVPHLLRCKGFGPDPLFLDQLLICRPAFGTPSIDSKDFRFVANPPSVIKITHCVGDKGMLTMRRPSPPCICSRQASVAKNKSLYVPGKWTARQSQMGQGNTGYL
jgi:hypothetical protein